jgi:hypothetical protein
MDNREQVARGRLAAELIDNPLALEAFDAVRERLQTIMVTARTDEATLRAKQMIGLLNDVQAYWQRVVQEGRFAAQTIMLEETKEKAARKWFSGRAA